MHAVVAALVAAATLFLPLVPASAQGIEIGPGGVRFYDERPRVYTERPRGGGGYCEQLRLACVNKERLGEVGEGNCRRYREACQRPPRADLCAELRNACLYKERLGEVGEGNCRRYRRMCRGEY